MFPAHGQVHEGEHVELRHDGEAQEHAVQEEASAAQLLVQLPLVQVNAKHLQHTGRQRAAAEGPLNEARILSGPTKSIFHIVELKAIRIKKRGSQDLLVVGKSLEKVLSTGVTKIVIADLLPWTPALYGLVLASQF